MTGSELIKSELLRQLEDLSAEIRSFAEKHRTLGDGSPEPNDFHEKADRLLVASLEVRKLLSHLTQESGAHRTEQHGFQLAALQTPPSAGQIQSLELLIPRSLANLVLARNTSNLSRDMLLSLVVARKSIRDLLISDFGCTPEMASNAEAAIRDFLKDERKFDLDEKLGQPFEIAASVSPDKLPDSPPAYPYSPRMEGGIEKYLRDNWASFIQAGIFSRVDLKRIDRPAYYALNNFLKGGKDGRRELPSDIDLPDRSAAVERDVTRAGLDQKQARRIANALSRRDKPKP